MKLKQSTIKDFAEALGYDTIDDVEIGEARREFYQKAIPNVSIKYNLNEIFMLSTLKEALQAGLQTFINLIKFVLFFALFPLVVVQNFAYKGKYIKILYFYLIKHRKEIKAYKKYLQDTKETHKHI